MPKVKKKKKKNQKKIESKIPSLRETEWKELQDKHNGTQMGFQF